MLSIGFRDDKSCGTVGWDSDLLSTTEKCTCNCNYARLFYLFGHDLKDLHGNKQVFSFIVFYRNKIFWSFKKSLNENPRVERQRQEQRLRGISNFTLFKTQWEWDVYSQSTVHLYTNGLFTYSTRALPSEDRCEQVSGSVISKLSQPSTWRRQVITQVCAATCLFYDAI